MYHDYYLFFGSQGVATPSMYSVNDLPLEAEYNIIDAVKTFPDQNRKHKYTPLGISFHGPDLIYLYFERLLKSDKDRLYNDFFIRSHDAAGSEILS